MDKCSGRNIVHAQCTNLSATAGNLLATCWLEYTTGTAITSAARTVALVLHGGCMRPNTDKIQCTTSQTQTNFGCVDRSRANLRCKPLTTERCKPLTSAPYRKCPGPPPRRRLHRLPRRRFHRRWRLYLLPALRHSGLANRRVARKPCWRRASIGGADVWKARDGRLVLSIDLGVGVTAVTAHYGPLAGLAVLRTVQGLQPNVTATRRSRAHSA